MKEKISKVLNTGWKIFYNLFMTTWCGWSLCFIPQYIKLAITAREEAGGDTLWLAGAYFFLGILVVVTICSIKNLVKLFEPRSDTTAV